MWIVKCVSFPLPHPFRRKIEQNAMMDFFSQHSHPFLPRSVCARAVRVCVHTPNHFEFSHKHLFFLQAIESSCKTKESPDSNSKTHSIHSRAFVCVCVYVTLSWTDNWQCQILNRAARISNRRRLFADRFFVDDFVCVRARFAHCSAAESDEFRILPPFKQKQIP